MNDEYIVSTKYSVLEKVKVSDIINDFGKYKNYYFIEADDEEPVAINRYCSYIENNLNKNKQVWVLEYNNETIGFVK